MRIAKTQPPSQKSNYTQQDLRQTELWAEIDDYFKNIFDPSVDKVSGASELAASPDGKKIAFTGSIHGADWRETSPRSKICLLDVETSALDVITSGVSSERLPKWSPDGKTLAFLSDRDEAGLFQLFLLSVGGLGEAKPATKVSGMVENFYWSPEGSRVLIQAAGRDADRDDGSGSGKVGQPKKDLPAWMPKVDSGDLSEAWRTLWIYSFVDTSLEPVTSRSNPWEAAWLGPMAILSIASDSPLEDAWYNATLRITSLTDGSERVVYVPKRQLGCPVATPSGDKIAVIEAVASDRGLTAGDVRIIDPVTGAVQELPLRGGRAMDATQLVWRDEFNLFAIGLRGLETVAQQWPPYPWLSTWVTPEAAGGGMSPSATLLPNDQFAVVVESWEKAPAIRIEGIGKSKTLLSFDHDGLKNLRSKLGSVEPFTWSGSDDLEIQAFLHRPKKEGKAGLICSVHGGPTFQHMNTAAGVAMTALLNSKGYAVLRPNPRGSSGRGQKFAEAVLGDMGGEDAQDILLGIKAVCDSEPSKFDADRIGVIGGSYGGYMASLLPTLDPCFKASVSMAAVTDWHSFHTTTNIPTFDQLFLNADPFNQKGGKYLTRSPIMNAGKYKTPVIQTAGLDDLAVPYSQAVQYHQACLQKGVESAIAMYPGEGHGVRKFPAMIDLWVRAVGWFDRFMPA
jgi:dipeptidyl aminopeptidase/acylaminoacyl peptidase